MLADPDIIRQVTVKGFSTFPNRLVRAHTHAYGRQKGSNLCLIVDVLKIRAPK